MGGLMNQLTLDRLRYGFQQRLSREFVYDAEVKIIEDALFDMAVMQIRFDLFSKDAGIYTYQTPKTWRDRLKQDIRWIRRVFGDPEYDTTRLMVRVVLDPQGKQFATDPRSRQLVMPMMEELSSFDWNRQYEADECVQIEDMKFYPTIYKMSENER